MSNTVNNKKNISPDLELRRLETIFNTFVKMKKEERERVLKYLLSRFNQDVKKYKP